MTPKTLFNQQLLATHDLSYQNEILIVNSRHVSDVIYHLYWNQKSISLNTVNILLQYYLSKSANTSMFSFTEIIFELTSINS